MIRAYSEMYLSDARRTLAGSFDAAVYTYGYELPEYFHFFINTSYSTKFETGDPFVISGMSGIELAQRVISQYTGEEIWKDPVFNDDRSPEYWTGWAMSYYQWYSGCTFKTLNEEVPIETILNMYPKYHEMDITQFNDRINELRSAARNVSYLKTYRERLGYSQSEVASLTGIPLRTLQQYEQGQKSINRARADYIISLANVLNVEPKALMEIDG